jgi:hypothetical protein
MNLERTKSLPYDIARLEWEASRSLRTRFHAIADGTARESEIHKSKRTRRMV